jgi:hypothetical protein
MPCQHFTRLSIYVEAAFRRVRFYRNRNLWRDVVYHQGDQIGRIFASLAIVYFASFLIEEEAKMFGILFSKNKLSMY